MNIHINKCTDPSAWYADRVGQVLPVERVEINRHADQGIPEDIYWCREGGTFNAINYVRVSDASVVADKPIPREQRKWWAVTDDSVRLVTGYSCAPNTPDHWWCPEVGSSLSEKHHLFTTESAALDNLILTMQRRREETEEIITALRARRQGLLE